jgi:hypothetical protein
VWKLTSARGSIVSRIVYCIVGGKSCYHATVYMVVEDLHLIRMDQKKYLVAMCFIMQNIFLKLSSFATARSKLCYQGTVLLVVINGH